MELRCSNPKCESREINGTHQEPFFNVTVTVYSNRSLAENLHKLDAGQFKCGMCGADAEVLTCKKCTHCGKESVVIVEADEPYNPKHLQCTECDSTFCLEEMEEDTEDGS